jgi:acetyl esterase/lipase
MRQLLAPLAVVASLFLTHAAHASRVVLKDGRVLQGKIVLLEGLAESPSNARPEGAPEPRKIEMIDDGLRRTFVSLRQVQEVNEGDAGEAIESISIKGQRVARAGNRVVSLGRLSKITPFDGFGHRGLQMATAKGNAFVLQGITQVTPTFSKVEALIPGNGTPYVWEQRIATTSIPPETLDEILHKQIDPKNVEQRLMIVRLYIQMERYNEAGRELKAVIADFPEHADKFKPTNRALQQRYAQRILDEVEVLGKAGRHRLATSMLANFPTEDVAGETLQKVRELYEQYKADYETGQKLLKQLDEYIKLIQETTLRERIGTVAKEIKDELNYNTLSRMAAFRQSIEDAQMPPEEKIALAVSGWLIGDKAAVRKLPVALSLFTVRNRIDEYLTEPVKLKREQILERLRSEEGYTPEFVAKLVAHMKPPFAAPDATAGLPGFYEQSLAASDGQLAITYYVQLPPEYDPHRKYPAILTLHGGGTTPQMQIDWWAGPPAKDGVRLGHATRNGYIVIAPAWGKPQQATYNFSAEEHAAVLNTLRDACRKFSIDTDRVFISGHSMGGDAAWDIGLAHPDLWAGMIPIVAVADKYITRYWEQAKYVPFYLISGELDGDKTVRNADHLNRYFNHNFDATVAEFQGRGHENFSDEIIRVFDWMGRKKRDFAMKDFVGLSMRPWDNFFWWVELSEFPRKTMVDPADWPPPSGTIPAKSKALINATNGITVSTGANRVTLWLSPELIDFKQKITFTVNRGGLRMAQPFIEPDAKIILEDVRTRGDRQHPFWAKVEAPSGRVNVAGQ